MPTLVGDPAEPNTKCLEAQTLPMEVVVELIMMVAVKSRADA